MNHFAMIIFGASGDLTKRKLIPALYTLYKEQRLTGNFSILGVSRTKYDDQSFQTYMWEEMQHFIKKELQDNHGHVYDSSSFICSISNRVVERRKDRASQKSIG